MWEWKWALPACHCSHSWVEHPLLLPIHQPPEVEQTAQPEPAPSPPPGSGPPPAYGWHLPHSPHYWRESEGKRKAEEEVMERQKESQQRALKPFHPTVFHTLNLCFSMADDSYHSTQREQIRA